MNPWPESRPEVLKMLEQLCTWCQTARAELSALWRPLEKLPEEAVAGVSHELDNMGETIYEIAQFTETLECMIVDTIAGKAPADDDAFLGAVERRQAEARAAMKRVLTPSEQTVYEMRVIEGWHTQQEVADDLGVSQGWVSTLEARAKKKMQTEIGWIPYGHPMD